MQTHCEDDAALTDNTPTVLVVLLMETRWAVLRLTSFCLTVRMVESHVHAKQHVAHLRATTTVFHGIATRSIVAGTRIQLGKLGKQSVTAICCRMLFVVGSVSV